MHEVIARPRNSSNRVIDICGGASLAHQMGLASNREDVALYFEITRTVGELCERCLPINKRLSKFDGSKDAVVKEVVRIHPILKRYEGVWPVYVLITRHRVIRKAGSPTGIIRSSKEIAIMQRTLCMQGAFAVDGSPVKDKKKSYKATPNETNAQSFGVDDLPKPAVSSGQVSEDRVDHVEPVVRFLSCLAQDLSFLGPVFVHYGVNDEESLRGIRRMSRWRSWMYSWVKDELLTELQWKMIVDGLEKMS